MRFLCLHGVGDHRPSRRWQSEWQQSVRQAIRRSGRDVDAEFEFVGYDYLFDRYPLGFWDTLEAVQRLLHSGGSQLWRRVSAQEGLFDGINQTVRWTAGMVVQWVENDQLREELRELVITAIERYRPDVILAHSLGSLVGYDALSHPDGRGTLEGGTFVAFGSQIGNPFVVGNFLAGRIEPLPETIWYHLFNRWDDVFTNSIRLSDPSFAEIETPFGEFGSLDHDATKYLTHDNSVSRLWSVLPEAIDERFRGGQLTGTRRQREPISRALLVGIDNYREPRHRLQGSVNDVFLISSLLQENGFSPDGIRLLVNERATAPAIRERLEWLLHDAQPDDRLVFHFSGHGVALPGYNAQTVIDRIYECLVPFDFDGSLESAVTDEQLYSMYVNLPYQTQLLMILDCCHAGGQARAGAPVRGIDPPEDIRHRGMRWDAERQLWVARDLPPLTPRVAQGEGDVERFAGEHGSWVRMGRAMPVRQLSRSEFRQQVAARHHQGPYMPVILQACLSNEQAYEYHHGGAAFGAFSFAIAHSLRRLNGFQEAKQSPITATQLIARVRETVQQELQLPQTPAAVGPEAVVEQQALLGR